MSDDKINVKVKMTSNNSTFDISIDKTGTVLDLKKACTEHTQLKETEQNLVYKGRILVDEKTIADYNIMNDHTIILVKKFVPEVKAEEKTTTTTTSNSVDPFAVFQAQPIEGGSSSGLSGLSGLGGMGQSGLGGLGGIDPSQLNSMMSNPQYMNMMNEMLGDPNTLNMIMNSSQLKPLLDSNPQLRQMMSNPQMMQQMMNPQNLQNAMNMMGQGGQGGQSGLGGQSGSQGFNPYGSK